MAKIIFEAKKAHIFFPFIIDLCKPGRGQLVGEIILSMAHFGKQSSRIVSYVQSIKAVKYAF